MNAYLCLMRTVSAKRDLIYANFFTGLGDGLIVPFIVGMLTFAFSNQSGRSLLLLLIAAIVGGLVFGFARYFGELEEIEHNHPYFSEMESARELAMMEYLGIDSELRVEMKEKMAEEKNYWMEEIQENQLDWDAVNRNRSLKGGIQTGISFLIGGIISLVIFYFSQIYFLVFSVNFFLSTAVPVLALAAVIGGCKALFTGRPFVKGAFFNLVYGIFSLTMPAIIAWLLITQS